MDIGKNEYFKFSAKLGVTKHLGGAKSTDELMQLCHVNKDSYILEVGCGVGFVSSYIAKKYGCRIMSIDIREDMVEIARERAGNKGIDNQIEFRVANAEKLPFKDNTFDVVFTESVTAFTDMKKSIPEYIRVTKKGGHVGLCEAAYFEDTPKEVKEFMHSTAGSINPLPVDKWNEVINKSGLTDIVTKSDHIRFWSQAYHEMRLYGWDIVPAMGKAIRQSISDPEIKATIKKMKSKMKNRPKGFMKHLGWWIGVGRKK